MECVLSAGTIKKRTAYCVVSNICPVQSLGYLIVVKGDGYVETLKGKRLRGGEWVKQVNFENASAVGNK